MTEVVKIYDDLSQIKVRLTIAGVTVKEVHGSFIGSKFDSHASYVEEVKPG